MNSRFAARPKQLLRQDDEDPEVPQLELVGRGGGKGNDSRTES
jgi:hypothetical protein